MKTRCTKCETVFNVNEEQLALRNGLVRCGICKTVFNGEEALLPEEDDFPVLEHEQAVWPANPSTDEKEVRNIYPEDEPGEVLAELREPALDDGPDFHLSHDAGIYTGQNEEPILGAMAGNGHIDDPIVLHDEPVLAAHNEPPIMVEQEEDDDDSTYHGRNNSIYWILGIFFGLIILAAQGMYVYRNQLVKVVPSLEPVLMQMCSVFGCELGSDKNLASLQLKNWVLKPDLQAKPQEGVTALRLQVTLRNNDRRAQVWPLLVLSLKNAQGVVEITKILEPKEYMLADFLLRPLQPDTEVFINLPLALPNTIAVSSFELRPYYP